MPPLLLSNAAGEMMFITSKNREAVETPKHGIHIHKDSHIDHWLSKDQLDYVLNHADSVSNGETGKVILSFNLPERLGAVMCGLYGPFMMDDPIDESEVFYTERGLRRYKSRCIERKYRPTRQVTVIFGPHDGHSRVLFTAFGGPLAPKEPNDPTCEDRAASEKFWSVHALVAIKPTFVNERF